MITVKLTEKEALNAFHSLKDQEQDYIENWDDDYRHIKGGKRYLNSLKSASLKIWIAIGKSLEKKERT